MHVAVPPRPTLRLEAPELCDSAQNTRVSLLNLRNLEFPKELRAGQVWSIEGTIPIVPLVEGDYSIGLTVNAGEFFENVFEHVSLTIDPADREEGDVPIPLVYRGVVELGSPQLTSNLRG